jgi:MFS family permease
MRSEKRSALFVSFFSMFSFLFSMQAIPPILPTLIGQFGLGFALASSLMWLVALPGLLLSILGGFLTQKFGVKPLSITGTAVMAASSALCSFSSSILFLQMSRLLLGIGGALVVVSAPSLIYQWFEKSELGTAMGIFGLTMPAATVMSFNSLGLLAVGYGWKAAFLLTMVLNMLALVLCMFLTNEKRIVTHEKTRLVPLRNMNIWILGAIWAFFNMAAVGYSTWGKTIFMRYGLPAGTSGLLASMLMLGVLTTPLTGFISDKAGGRRRFFIIVASGSMFLIFPLFPYVETSFLVGLALVLGLLTAFLPPTLFALPEEILGAGKAGLGWAVLNTYMNLGFIIGPLAVGYVLDIANWTAKAFLLLSLFALCSLLLALILKSS